MDFITDIKLVYLLCFVSLCRGISTSTSTTEVPDIILNSTTAEAPQPDTTSTTTELPTQATDGQDSATATTQLPTSPTSRSDDGQDSTTTETTQSYSTTTPTGKSSVFAQECEASVDMMNLAYGPVAGGTNVTIEGSALDEVDSVNFNGIQGQIYFQTGTSLTFVTPSMLTAGTQRLTLNCTNGKTSDSGENFIFKANPVVQNIEPLDVFLSGGTILTITGQHLDSVSSPMLIVTMVYTWNDTTGATQDESQEFTSGCSVSTAAEMLCMTPALTIPEKYNVSSTQTKRRKRDTREQTRYPSAAHTRNRRSVVTIDTDEASLKFYLGFVFDGFLDYNSLSTALPAFAELTVYNAPTFKCADKPVTFEFSDTSKAIIIQGEDFLNGASPGDYQIWVGNETCENVTVNASLIACYPPQSLPGRLNASHAGLEEYVRTVRIYLNDVLLSEACQLVYSEPNDKKTDLYIIIGASVGGFVAVVAILAILCRCFNKDCKPREKGTGLIERRNTESSSHGGSLRDSYYNGGHAHYRDSQYSESPYRYDAAMHYPMGISTRAPRGWKKPATKTGFDNDASSSGFHDVYRGHIMPYQRDFVDYRPSTTGYVKPLFYDDSVLGETESSLNNPFSFKSRNGFI